MIKVNVIDNESIFYANYIASKYITPQLQNIKPHICKRRKQIHDRDFNELLSVTDKANRQTSKTIQRI